MPPPVHGTGVAERFLARVTGPDRSPFVGLIVRNYIPSCPAAQECTGRRIPASADGQAVIALPRHEAGGQADHAGPSIFSPFQDNQANMSRQVCAVEFFDGYRAHLHL